MEPIILIQSPYYPIRYWKQLYTLLVKQSYKVYLVEYPDSPYLTRPLLGALQFELQVAIKKKMAAKGIDGKVHIIAHGWACLLVAYFAKSLQESIRSVTMLSPMGVHSKITTWEALISWPILGDLLHSLFTAKIWREEFSGLNSDDFRPFSPRRQRTVLQANKILHQEGVQQYYENLVQSKLPLLILIGIQTKRYQQPIHPTFKYWRADVFMAPIKNGEHFLSCESPQEVINALEKFWKTLKS